MLSIPCVILFQPHNSRRQTLLLAHVTDVETEAQKFGVAIPRPQGSQEEELDLNAGIPSPKATTLQMRVGKKSFSRIKTQ